MSVDRSRLKPGDVIAVGTKDVGGWFIRLRSRLMGQPALQNHIVMFTHYDTDGNPRGLEGKPSSFGWVNLDKYLEHPSAVSNAGRTTFTDDERWALVGKAEELVGLPYDWTAIIGLALTTLRLPFLPQEWPEAGLPSQGTCASAIDVLYEWFKHPNPGGFLRTRGTDVDDWVTFFNS